MIPPPSAVTGLFGAILGVPRNKLREFSREQNVLAGAELRGLGGYYTTVSRIFKFDRSASEVRSLLKEFLTRKPKGKRKLEDVYKDVVGLLPLKEGEELFEPEYKLAIAAKDEVVKEGLRRVRGLDFEYEIFGGNDYHFVEYVGDVREASLIKSEKGSGYCPVSEMGGIEARSYTIVNNAALSLGRGIPRFPIVIFAPMGPEMETFAFVFGANIIAAREMSVVSDGESTIFVYNPTKYLV